MEIIDMGIRSVFLAWLFFSVCLSASYGQVHRVVVPDSVGIGFSHLQYNPPLVPGHTHFGVDIMAACGKVIFPLSSGRVVRVSNNTNGLGYAVMLLHPGLARNGGDLYTIYLHMQEAPNINGRDLAPGDAVYSGIAIGKIGDTGFAEGCHTHFEIRSFYFPEVAEGWYHPQSKRCGDGKLNIYACGDQRIAPWALSDWENPLTFQVRNSQCNPSKERCPIRINGPIGWYPPVDLCGQASQWFNIATVNGEKIAVGSTTKAFCPIMCYAN